MPKARFDEQIISVTKVTTELGKPMPPYCGSQAIPVQPPSMNSL